MREIPQVVITNYEDIISYECNFQSRFVKVLVGSGTLSAEGIFTPYENQNYQYYIIDGQEYENLMSATDSKPSGVFRKDDLWPFIDTYRQKIYQEEQVRVANMEAEILNVKSKNTI